MRHVNAEGAACCVELRAYGRSRCVDAVGYSPVVRRCHACSGVAGVALVDGNEGLSGLGAGNMSASDGQNRTRRIRLCLNGIRKKTAWLDPLSPLSHLDEIKYVSDTGIGRTFAELGAPAMRKCWDYAVIFGWMADVTHL